MAAWQNKFRPVGTGISAKVFIGFLPAACMGNPQICPMFDGPKPHVGGTIIKGSSRVNIGYKPAARVSDTTECKGPPGTVALGEFTVMIGGLPAIALARNHGALRIRLALHQLRPLSRRRAPNSAGLADLAEAAPAATRAAAADRHSAIPPITTSTIVAGSDTTCPRISPPGNWERSVTDAENGRSDAGNAQE